jgi:predicted metal-binding membrane protein
MSAHVDTRTSRAAVATAVAATLAVAAACWLVAIREMDGMDMGVASEHGSFSFFITAWVPMMAAMMLPGALPAVLRRARAGGRRVHDALLFTASYLTVWTLVGLAVYALYRPHGTWLAGALTVAAGGYELTPLKRGCRRRCREDARSGFGFGLACLGSSAGLMLMLVAVGVMSVSWMGVIAALVLAQKLLPPRVLVDLPVAVAIVALGVLIVLAPGSVPGLTPTM